MSKKYMLGKQVQQNTTSCNSLFPIAKDFDNWRSEDIRRFWRSNKMGKNTNLVMEYLKERRILMDGSTINKLCRYIDSMLDYAMNERLNNVKNS